MNSPPRVHLLSPRLANQIAAGEVVERPASVLKELLENSLDSGASRIRVAVEGAGSRLIRVQDDGCGIHRDDLQLAVSRHATSKIGELADLECISSMGFRGEALASVASVSRCRIVSRTEGMESAWSIEVAGSELQGEPTPEAGEVGTTLEVRDLFFNTPVRRRFLRSERTEQGHLEEVFRRVALSRFDISFTLHNAQRCVYRLHGCTDRKGRERRLMQLCGKGFLEHALHIEFEASGMRLWGWVAGPEFTRSQTDMQYFYLNGRAIRDRLVNHAVRQAWQERLPAGRHPAYVLFLEMAPEQVDVNVHPTKHEVRFREARLVHDFLLGCLQRALQGDPCVAEPDESPRGTARPSGASSEGASASVGRRTGAAAVGEQIGLYRRLHEAQPVAEDDPDGAAARQWQLVDELFGRYLLARQEERLFLIDIRMARELLLRERLQAADEAGAVASQPLLLPQPLELDRACAAALERYGERLRDLGLEVTATAPGRAVIRRLPGILQGCDAEGLVAGLLDDLAHGSPTQELRVLLARHGAAAIGRSSRDELHNLLREVRPLLARQDGSALCRELRPEDLAGLFQQRDSTARFPL